MKGAKEYGFKKCISTYTLVFYKLPFYCEDLFTRYFQYAAWAGVLIY